VDKERGVREARAVDRRIPWVIGGVLVLIAVAGHSLRAGLDLPLEPVAIRAWVHELGWRGPFVFLLLVTFRQFLAIPAMLILCVGGLCFGTMVGGLLGTTGLIVSGTMKFAIARAVGRDYLRRLGGGRLERWEARARRLGFAVVALATAHPMGPLAPLHWGAGLSPLSLGSFVGALALGAPVRAFAVSFFGETLLDTGSTEFRVAALALVAVIVIPLVLLRGRRERLLGV
jgi:uncharacterized membrane protein YdjX (TVP38/TMEM64 family)